MTGRTVDLGGFETWYEERGRGEPLVLLHPGGVDSAVFEPNVRELADHFHVFMPERRGHGHTRDRPGPITYDAMAEDTVAFIDEVVAGPARIMGCSDGGIVALSVAFRRPDLVERLALVAAPFHRDGWEPQAIDPTNELPTFLRDRYGEVSPDGIEHYDIVAAKLATMHAAGPTFTLDDIRTIGARTLVMLGDDDEVTFEHAGAMYRVLPDGELTVVPGTSHGLLVEKPELCNRILLDFFGNDPVATYAPIRRVAR